MVLKHCFVCDTGFTINEPQNTNIYQISLEDHINSKFHQRKLKSGLTKDELEILIRYASTGLYMNNPWLYRKIEQLLGVFD